ncbi:outer membrane beta-barrel protein [Microbacter margulisiae]|uniref:Outer membrane protein beta-barrel domain-containing protein n=1 Tax=Microbacter margulisiae TaxID=1350067 RepID=A0A7W5DNZ8_9PORP|nr:outer membrane beta-barrel protein [Microbacter margulisiae]MBB3186371.1 hypothetical protein [Microbacter margulisiae]
MKLLLLFLFCILAYANSLAQSKSEVFLMYGYAGNDILMNEDVLGDMGYHGKAGNMYELSYIRFLNRNLAIETGVNYSENEVRMTYFPTGVLHSENIRIKMISIPVWANFSFLKYWFINAGPLVDFEIKHSPSQSTQDQSGIGLGIGVGAKYKLGRITFKINPFIQEHAVVPFLKKQFNEKLIENGVKIGIGYSF